MFDPQLAINTAFTAALSNPPLVNDWATMPVYTHVPRGTGNYVLLSQPTLVQGPGFAACASWDGTVLVSAYTSFPDEETVSDQYAYVTSSEILERLLDKRLPLGPGFYMSPITVALATTTQSFNGDNMVVGRVLRLRFTVDAER